MDHTVINVVSLQILVIFAINGVSCLQLESLATLSRVRSEGVFRMVVAQNGSLTKCVNVSTNKPLGKPKIFGPQLVDTLTH